jgi:hypothetical protein
MMTRKDYVSTAEILDTLVATTEGEAFDAVLDAIDAFADMFAKDNERFDRNRFLNACGIYSA